MLNKFTKFTKVSTLVITILTFMSPTVVLADHTDDGLYICNKTSYLRAFALIDIDTYTPKVFIMEPKECQEFWNYEEILFVPNSADTENYKTYQLNENYNYYFDYDSRGNLEVYKQLDV